MGQINTNNYPTVDSLLDADLLIVENATNGTGTTTPKQLRENAIGTDTLHTSAQSVTGAINELKGEIDAGAGVVCYDVNTITSGYLGGQFSGSANLLLLHLTTDGTADATNGYMMMLSYSRPVARFAYGRLVDADGVAYKQDVYADNTIICKISNSGEGTESDPEQVVILGIINTGFMLTPTAVVSDRDIIDGQGNTLSVLAEALTKTASGNPVVITDCAGGKARSLVTSIEPIQDLHGYDKPWVGGAGKNKLEYPYVTASSTINGVTLTVNSDGTVKANGTATANVNFVLSNKQRLDKLASGTYIMNGCPTGGDPDGTTYFLGFYAPNKSAYDFGSGANISLSGNEHESANIYIRISNGYTANNLVFKPMIRLATESDATFAPYSNICPISGRDSVAVDDTGKNLIAGWQKNTAIDNNGEPYTSAGSVTTSNKIHAEVGDSFIYSSETIAGAAYYIQTYDAYDNYIGYKQITFGTAFIPTNFDSRIRSFYIQINGSNIGNTPPETAQLERGTTATPYEPYAHSSATIQLGQTVYGADINWDTGVGTVDRKIYTFSGTGEDWTLDGKRFKFLKPSDWAGESAQYANPDKVISNQATLLYNDVYGAYFSITNGWLWVNALDSSETLASFRARLAETPIQIVGMLATPTTIQLTPEQLQMLKGYNRVTIESGSIELGYIAKLT